MYNWLATEIFDVGYGLMLVGVLIVCFAGYSGECVCALVVLFCWRHMSAVHGLFVFVPSITMIESMTVSKFIND